MRYVFGLLSVAALILLASVGCSEGGGTDLCKGVECFPCTEQGIRDAIAEGGGPHFFACDGPTTVVTEAEIVIDNDVILDGEGKLTVDGDGDHRVFSVPQSVTAQLRGVSVRRGRALGEVPEDRSGGGIRNYGNLTLTNSTVSGNTADVGGGIGNVGDLTLTNSTVSDNTATGYGGGLANFDGTLTLTNSTVSDNTAVSDNAGYGGGIHNYSGTLTLINSNVSGNSAKYTGGGIGNVGDLELTNSTVSDNTASDGGGINNAAGVYLTLTNSTVSGNTAAYGGGINNDGTLTLTNSTVSRNSAYQYGGGIYNTYEPLTVTNSTVSDNTASDGGGIYNEGTTGATLTLTNTLVDNDCAGGFSVVSGGSNLESPGDTCGFDDPTDQVNVSREQLSLGPLQDNGGPTETHALGTGSVAIDVIPEADCQVDTDQRGEPRPEPGGTMCDVGAFEVQP